MVMLPDATGRLRSAEAIRLPYEPHVHNNGVAQSTRLDDMEADAAQRRERQKAEEEHQAMLRRKAEHFDRPRDNEVRRQQNWDQMVAGQRT
ncbi:hypothetical protein [Teichococcus aestuarii]